MSRLPKNSTKSATITKLLTRERGTTIAEIVKATGWKEHSIRAFLTGVRKSATLVKEQRSDGETAYRIRVDESVPMATVDPAAS